jgi:Disulphide bond corrector protein DsbC
MRTSLLSRHVVGSAMLVLVGLTGCEEGAGKLDEPKDPTPGVREKPDPKAAKDLPPDFDGALRMTSSLVNDAAAKSATLTVTVTIAPGYHAYAPGEEIGKPIGLFVDAVNGWTLDGSVVVPAGTEKDLGELGKSMILEGSVPLSAKVVGGTGKLTGHALVQICTDDACDKPRKHPFVVDTI